MVNFSEFEEYKSAALELVKQRPHKCRLVVKYRHKAQRLQMKVTDDKQCLKFEAFRQGDLKKLEKFSAYFLRCTLTKGIQKTAMKSLTDKVDEEISSAPKAVLPSPKAKAEAKSEQKSKVQKKKKK